MSEIIARYADQTLTGSSFKEVGDVLAAEGFDMASARYVGDTLHIPHTDHRRRPATVVQRKPPRPPPMPAPLPVPKMEPAKQIELTCRDCGTVHPEGAVCSIPIYFEVKCCHEKVYPHPGPHEAKNRAGQITHRWITEIVVTDMPFNAYGPDGYDLGGDLWAAGADE